MKQDNINIKILHIFAIIASNVNVYSEELVGKIQELADLIIGSEDK